MTTIFGDTGRLMPDDSRRSQRPMPDARRQIHDDQDYKAMTTAT